MSIGKIDSAVALRSAALTASRGVAAAAAERAPELVDELGDLVLRVQEEQ